MRKPLVLQIPEPTSPSGYAEFGVNLAVELYRRGVDLQLAPVWWDPRICPVPDRKAKVLKDLHRTGQNIVAENIVYLQLPDQPQPEPSKCNMIYTMFETDGLPNPWVNHLNHDKFDRVLVPSEFNRKTFSRSGVRLDKISVVPLGIDLEELDAIAPHHRQRFRDALLANHLDVRCLFMASMQGQPRKNLEGLIVNFLKTFRDRTDVALLIKVDGVANMAEKMRATRVAVQAEMARLRPLSGDPLLGLLPTVLYTPQILPLDMMNTLLSVADCYVSTSHGEGADMAAMKAAAMGIPILVPRWSGYLSYADDSWAMPPLRFSEAHNRGIVTDGYYRNQLWCDPTLEAVALSPEEALLAEKHGRPVETFADRLREVSSWVLDGKPSNHPIATIHIPARKTRVRSANSIQATAESLLEIMDRPSGKRVFVRSLPEDASPRPVMLIPSPSLPCGIWESSVQLAQEIPGCMVARDHGSCFQMIENHNVHVVHLQLEYGFYHHNRLEHVLRSLREYGVSIVVTMHSYREGVPHNDVVERYADRIIVHNPSIRIPPSREYHANQPEIFRPLHFPPPWKPSRNLPSMAAREGEILGFFGFSFHHKGLREWMLALKELKKSRPRLQGIAVAPIHPTPNPSTMYLTEWAREAKISSFIALVHQYLPEQSVFQTLSHCNLICLPYLPTPWKGSSAAVRFMARLDKPILITDTPFFDDLPTHGFLRIPSTVVQDPKAFARKLSSALDRVKDPEKRNHILDYMARYRDQHSTKNEAEFYRDMYSLLHRSAASGDPEVPCEADHEEASDE